MAVAPTLPVEPPSPSPAPAGLYDLLVVGAGPAGLAAARIAATLGARVALIERDRLGGSSLNVGSVPSKSILRTSRLYADMRDPENFGGRPPDEIEIDFAAVMARMRRFRSRIGDGASVDRLADAGIDVFFGQARFTGRRSVEVGMALANSHDRVILGVSADFVFVEPSASPIRSIHLGTPPETRGSQIADGALDPLC